jgi:mono/diheme cytochrome c family protein
MPLSLNPTRLLVLLAAAGLAAVAGSGCGTGSADIERGRVLFTQQCGSCHELAQAGTAPGVGPNLDDAFAVARADGMDSDTIEGIVAAQVENPRPSTDNPAVSMPADLVTGKDLEDVAAYVARYAGVPGATPPKVPGGPGAQVFADNGCNGCHTLAEANAGGTTGPNLDEVLPGQTLAMIRESIVDPNAEIAQGFPPDVMPTTYEQDIPADQLADLVNFLVEATGGSPGGGGSASGAGGGKPGGKSGGAAKSGAGKGKRGGNAAGQGAG